VSNRYVTDEQRRRRPIFIATLWAGASWLFFGVALSTRISKIWVFVRALKKQPTDFRQSTSYFGDRTLAIGRSVLVGICRAAVAGTAAHLKSARFEHLGQSLGESLPTLRAQIATMQIDTDGLAARIDDLIDHLERPRDTTVLRVLESKAAAGDVAIAVTSAAMRTCGGAAFSKHLNIERLFRDAHAGAVMAPTGDVLRELIARATLGMPLF